MLKEGGENSSGYHVENEKSVYICVDYDMHGFHQHSTYNLVLIQANTTAIVIVIVLVEIVSGKQKSCKGIDKEDAVTSSHVMRNGT